MEYTDIFNNTTINLFTDASVRRVGDSFESAAGLMIWSDTKELIPVPPISFRRLFPSTNNEGEVYAIYMAVKSAIEINQFVSTQLTFNLFSDSLISVMGLTKWYKGWVENAVSMSSTKLLNSSGEEVKNQQIFIRIMNLLALSKLHINMYHIRGHIDATKETSLKKFMMDFARNNHVTITAELARSLIYFNDKIDNYSRQILDSKEIPASKGQFLFSHNISSYGCE